MRDRDRVEPLGRAFEVGVGVGGEMLSRKAVSEDFHGSIARGGSPSPHDTPARRRPRPRPARTGEGGRSSRGPTAAADPELIYI